MLQLQLPGVQVVSVITRHCSGSATVTRGVSCRRCCRFYAAVGGIQRISDEGMSTIGHVDTDLVWPP